MEGLRGFVDDRAAVGAAVGAAGARGAFSGGLRHPSRLHIPPPVKQATVSSCCRSASVELSDGAGGCATWAALVSQAVQISVTVAISTHHWVLRANRKVLLRMFT